MKLNQIFKIFLLMLCFACREDLLDNFRSDFSGYFLFITEIQNSSGIIDTIEYEGIIEPVYSNRQDIIYIQFLPDLKIDPLLTEKGQLINGTWWTQAGSSVSIHGSFSFDRKEITFNYQVGEGINYLLYRVSGFKISSP